MQNLSRTWASQLPPQCTTRSWRVWTLYIYVPFSLPSPSPFPFYPFQQHTRTTLGGYFVMAVFLPVSSLLSGTIDLVLFLVSTRAFFYTSHFKKIKASQLNYYYNWRPPLFSFSLPFFRLLQPCSSWEQRQDPIHEENWRSVLQSMAGRKERERIVATLHSWRVSADFVLLFLLLLPQHNGVGRVSYCVHGVGCAREWTWCSGVVRSWPHQQYDALYFFF